MIGYAGSLPAQPSEEPRVAVVRKATSSSADTRPLSSTGETIVISAATELLPHQHHDWARFQPGAWRTLQTVTETFDPNGKFIGRSETTQTDTLLEVTADTYTIESSTVVHIGGKKLRGSAQRTTRSLLTDTPVELQAVVALPAANLNLDGRIVPCQRWRLELGAGAQRRLETLYYNADLSPYVLRREALAADDTSAATEIQSTTTVVRVDAPVALDEGIFPGRHVSIDSQTGAHRVARLEVRTDVVPGGMVSASSTERDAAGRRVRWSTTELVDSGQAGDTPAPRQRWRLFKRRTP